MQTIRKEFTLNGIGLHTGKKVNLHFIPSDHGKVTFISKGINIDAHYDNVISTNFAVTLGRSGVSISTVEHLLSALHIFGIDSIYIEIDGPEIPIFEGSARIFVDAIKSIGTMDIDEKRTYFTVTEPFQVDMDDKYLLFLPSKKFEVKYTISFNHPLLDKVTEEFILNKKSYESKICFSRTFTFVNVIEGLREKGLIKGGSLDNAIVLDDDGIVNGDLRIENEWLKHKVLDLLGDIYLLGKPFMGRIVAYKSGHTLDVKAIRAISNHQRTVYAIPKPGYQFLPHFNK
jgi:UDP-3-O-acyl N-acetylglucosamine deacetylase